MSQRLIADYALGRLDLLSPKGLKCAIRPSLLLSEPYTLQDINTIATYKRAGVKDCRALLRWALAFVDQSGLQCQMQLASDINQKKLVATADQFALSEHLHGLWEMWLALTNSDRGQPASFFRQLLVSMPTEPEGPIVHVRRFLVDLIERDESPLLTDLDSDSGVFKKMVTYGTALGLKEARSSLSVMHGGGTPEKGGGWQQWWCFQWYGIQKEQEAQDPGLLQRVRMPRQRQGARRNLHQQGQLTTQARPNRKGRSARIREAHARIQRGKPRQIPEGLHQGCARVSRQERSVNELHGPGVISSR